MSTGHWRSRFYWVEGCRRLADSGVVVHMVDMFNRQLPTKSFTEVLKKSNVEFFKLMA